MLAALILVPTLNAFASPSIAQSAYTETVIEGWTIRAERTWVQAEPKQWADVQQEIGNQLYRVRRAIPAPALAKVRQVTIWVHKKSPETACMAFHPGAQWLRDHKMNPDMAGGVEIGNTDNFLSWTMMQPWMILHEMAHAYHFRFLENGFQNAEVEQGYRAAMEAKKYDSVLHGAGRTQKHYAANNPMEYFAEASEAYFGQNDFFPFVRAELKTSDPDTHNLIERLWALP